MIAAARSCFSDHRFDGETADCLRGFVVPWGGAWNVGCSSCLVPAYSWPCVSHFPGRLDCVFISLLVFLSSVLSLRPWRSRRRRASAAVMSRMLVLVLIISSIISCGEVGHSCRPRVPLHLIGVLSSHLGRLSCGGRRALPLISPCVSFSLSWGKRRRMGFFAHRHLMSSGFSFLISPFHLVWRLVPYLSS